MLGQERCEAGDGDVPEAVGGRRGVVVGAGERVELVVVAPGDEGEVGGEVGSVEALCDGGVDYLLLVSAVELGDPPDGLDTLVPVVGPGDGFDGLGDGSDGSLSG